MHTYDEKAVCDGGDGTFGIAHLEWVGDLGLAVLNYFDLPVT